MDQAQPKHRTLRLVALLGLGLVLIAVAWLLSDGDARQKIASLQPVGEVPDLAAAEPLPLRLIRTIHVGALQGTSLEEIQEVSSVETEESAELWTLSRAALSVLGQDHGWPEYPIGRLLEIQFDRLERSERDDLFELHELPLPGYGREDLIATLLYALAVTGQSDRATSILEMRLSAESAFVRGVALQGLFDLGTTRGKDLIQAHTEADDDNWILSTNLNGNSRFPTYLEVAQHWNQIPIHNRSRGALVRAAGQSCSNQAKLALYLLGFLAEAEGQYQEDELALLDRAATELPAQGCFAGRYFALRSLALRDPRTPEAWRNRYRSESQGWFRDLVGRIGFAHHGEAFVPEALSLVRAERERWVRWELLAGISFAPRPQVTYRDSWDLWHGSPHRQFRLSYPERYVNPEPAQVDTLLTWLERSNEPPIPDARQLEYLLRDVAMAARGRDTFRLLRAMHSSPMKTEVLDALWSITDPAALPYLRFLTDQREYAEHHERLAFAIRQLEDVEANLYTGRRPELCCERTEACLLSQWQDSVQRLGTERLSEEAVQAWLSAGSSTESAVQVDMIEQGIVADVVDGHGARTRFEYLFDCWRLIED